MDRPRLTRAPRLLAACLAGGALASVLAGQDANWDLLSYHLANGWALLHGRFGRDLVPSGMQSYLNPLLDAAYAALALGPLHDRPRLVAAAMGLWSGLAAFFAARLSLLLNDGRPVRAAAGLLLGLSGVAMVTQTGTTTGEVPAAAILLGGLLVLLQGSGARSAAWAGALFGAAAGLKLTAAAFAPAACLALLVRAPRRPLASAAFAAGWLAAIAATDGWQAWRLLRRFGSPTFPLFNSLFRSPWHPAADVVDARFMPHGLGQWLLYPLSWIAGLASPAELPLRDAAPALALCLALAASLAWIVRPSRPPFTPAQRAALAFLAAGYATWLRTSSILRYAVAIEILSGIVVPLLLARLLSGRALAAGLAASLALAAAADLYPPTLRAPYAPLSADAPPIAPGTLLVVTFRGPSSYVLALLPHPEDFTVLGLGGPVLEARGFLLHDEAVRRVREHRGPLMVITEGAAPGRFPELGEIGLDPELAGCRPIATSLAPASPTGLHACDARRLDPAPMPSPFWAQAALRYRTLVQPTGAGQALLGAAYLRAAGPAARGARLVDWTDLIWSGVGASHDALPDRLDPGALYVLDPAFVPAAAARIDPASDALGVVDGVIVAAPGWRRCAACTAPVGPLAAP